MATNKTVATDASVARYLDAIDDPQRRADCDALVALMQKVTGEPPVMWGSSIVGFGAYHYVYDSGREGDMCLTGFSSRKGALSIYLMTGFEDQPERMERLGRFKTGKSCLYVKRLADIDLEVLEALVRDDRADLMQKIEDGFNIAAAEFGVQVVDVRIRRADLPQENSEAIYARMRTEREREAAEFRAQGRETAQRIRSRADRDVTVLLAEAQRDAERIRGEGDAERNRIFAEAFGQDPGFFDFYRSMQAYRAGLKGDNTTVILSPDSEFFRYFGSDSGAARR